MIIVKLLNEAISIYFKSAEFFDNFVVWILIISFSFNVHNQLWKIGCGLWGSSTRCYFQAKRTDSQHRLGAKLHFRSFAPLHSVGWDNRTLVTTTSHEFLHSSKLHFFHEILIFNFSKSKSSTIKNYINNCVIFKNVQFWFVCFFNWKSVWRSIRFVSINWIKKDQKRWNLILTTITVKKH